jgi:hypothetical protein
MLLHTADAAQVGRMSMRGCATSVNCLAAAHGHALGNLQPGAMQERAHALQTHKKGGLCVMHPLQRCGCPCTPPCLLGSLQVPVAGRTSDCHTFRYASRLKPGLHVLTGYPGQATPRIGNPSLGLQVPWRCAGVHNAS